MGQQDKSKNSVTTQENAEEKRRGPSYYTQELLKKNQVESEFNILMSHDS